MSPEIFAEFLNRQGHRVVQTDSCYWYNARPGFYFYFPYHRLIRPNTEELSHVFRGQHCVGVRFFTPLEDVGRTSYNIICSDKQYDLPAVEAKARNQTRRGLENFEIKQIEVKELAHLGNQLNSETLARQGRDPSAHDEHQWGAYCRAATGLDGFDAWGAFTQGVLAAFMMGFQMEDHYTILHQSSSTEHLRLYPNNALVFAVTKLKLSLPEVNAVFYGPQSLDAPESLDTFKFRMGYRQVPMKQRIVFNPLLEPFVGGSLHKCVKLALKTRPQSNTLRKFEAIIRFYLEAE